MVKRQLAILALLVFSFAHAEEKVIQNGLDGYNGCTDSYLTEYGKDNGQPHGTVDLLRLRGGT